ncbi:MAG: hypothetical protein COA96_00935 [SAR86 cluster bacterium]|uniref:Transporter n=1 Tax=SAR86 cluster bacterium TaxID=2030880 RepID=A0A2A5BAP8_9GAMM|nr:MAG: hypothetical protein COA96_00935 [SAR86 cluster bacterium]
MPTKIFLWALLTINLLFVAHYTVAAENSNQPNHTLSVSSYYSNGDYGEKEDTSILYFPVSYGVDYGKFNFQIAIPYLQVNGVGSVLVNVGGINRAVAGTQRSHSSGLGDSVFSMTYQMDAVSESAPFIDLRLDIKLPTADESKGLGSGEVDYNLQVDFLKNVGNSLFFSTVGYSFRGKSSLYEGLQDSAFVQLGVARPLFEKWNIGVFYDYRERASVYSSEIHEVTPYFSWQFAKQWTFTGMTSWGFTADSADLSVLGQLSYRW